MAKSSHHHGHHRSDYDISGDVEKIKAALLATSRDVRGRAGEIITDSIDGMKEQSSMFKNQVADYTAEKPFTSLSIAFFTGIVMGYLLRK